MSPDVRHVGIVVQDLDHAVKFWVEIFGFSVVKRMEECGSHLDLMIGLKDVRVTTVKLMAAKGATLELLKFRSHPDKKKWKGKAFSTGITHIAFNVSDVDKVCQKIEKFGLTSSTTPQISPDGLVKVIYATGPEGVLLELVETLKP